MHYLRTDVAPDHVETRDVTDPRPRRRVLTVAERWIFDPNLRRLRWVRDVAADPNEAS
jgi:hypothetical protein